MAKIMNQRNKIVFFSLFLVFISVVIMTGFFCYQNNRSLQDGVYKFFYPSNCDQVKTFRIGTIDNKFGLTKNKLKELAGEAANTWNESYGETVLDYDKSAKLKINMVYDDRQLLNKEIVELSSSISSSSSKLKPEISKHQVQVADFENRMRDFNETVRYWNERGGASEDEYNKLIDRQAKLKTEAETLNANARKLNEASAEFNSEVKTYNSTITEFNDKLKDKPEEGLYESKNDTITLYYYVNDVEFKHTLTHELGHALGITHNQNPNAVMFAKTNQNLTLTKDDVSGLLQACKRVFLLDVLRDRYLQSGKRS